MVSVFPAVRRRSLGRCNRAGRTGCSRRGRLVFQVLAAPNLREASTQPRPEHVLLVAEVVSPGSETTDRIVKVDQYAKAGIGFYWRIEQAATGVPLVYTYVLDPATKTYRDGDVFTGVLKVAAPFPVEIDLGQI